MLLTKKIKIKIVPNNIKYLKDKYKDIKYSDIIEININDLSIKSGIYIDCSCDNCGDVSNIQYRKYIQNIGNYGFYTCKKCMNIKTKITKKNKYGDETYNNPQKMVSTKEKLGIYISFEQVDNFKIYRKIVNRFTYKSKKILYENWDGFDYYDNEYIKDNFRLKSKNMSYPTIDHKISIHEGFINNIPPYIIGSVDNICVTKRKINLFKRNKTNFNYWKCI